MRAIRFRREVTAVVGFTILAMILAVVLARVGAVLLQFDIGWRLHVTAIGVAAICGPIVIIPLVYANHRLAVMKRALEQLARTDPLTGLPNRRAFFASANEMFARSAGREPAAVLMIDIDRFKSVNDTFGHDAGDAVLKTVAATIFAVSADLAPGRALAARIGGEEFAVIVDGLGVAEASVLAEHVCARVRQTVTKHQGALISATVSIGVALRQGDEPIDLALKSADNAVYEAKHQGRDRWCMATTGAIGPARGASHELRSRAQAA